jgi:hypothetical protein
MYDALRGVVVSPVPNVGITGCDSLVWPETFLTKICIVSSSFEETELRLAMLDERRICMLDCGRGSMFDVR